MKIKKINVYKNTTETTRASGGIGGSNNSFSSSQVESASLDLSQYALKNEVKFTQGDGFNSVIEKDHSLQANNDYETAVGKYNQSVVDETIFTVGNGTDENERKNAFAVTTSGDAKVANRMTANSVSASTINSDTANLTNISSSEITNNGSIKSQSFSGTTANITTINSNNIANTDTIKTKNLVNTDTIKTKNLEVTGSAHFFELIIDKIKSAGGSIMLTPADGFEVEKIKSMANNFTLYWRCQDGNGKQRDNMWKVNDQALCMSFNQATVGTSHNVNNKYYWCLVTDVSDNNNPIEIDGQLYNYISISRFDSVGVVNPEVGDSIVMCGYRGTDDAARQSAIYISAYSSLDKGLTAPLIAQYQGINDFNLESHRKSYYDANRAKFIGEFEATDGQNIIDIINNKIAESEASIKLNTKNIVLSVSEKTKERRNLLKGTTFHRQLDNFTISSTARIEMNSGYKGTNCIHVIDATEAGNPHYVGVYWDGSQGGRSVKIEKGKKYTISCYYKTNDINAEFYLEAIYTDKQTKAKRLGQATYLSPNGFAPKKVNEWQLFTTVIDTTDAESDYIAFNFWEACTVAAGQIEAWICRPMVEEGAEYNGWTLSKEDYDYIGANLLDNSRTFDVGGNITLVKGKKKLVGDAYELRTTLGDDDNTFYIIDKNAFKTKTDYTMSFEIVTGTADYLGVYAYYPASTTKHDFYSENQNSLMTTHNLKINEVNHCVLLEEQNLSYNHKVWIHFNFKGKLPSYIYLNFPKNKKPGAITYSKTVVITKPKIEEGANVTEWTEKKTDVEKSLTTITNNVSTLTQKANSIESNVTSNTTNINNITGQLSSQSTSISRLEQKADSITSTISSMTKSNGTNIFSFTNTDFQNYWCRSAIQMNGFFTLKLNQGIYRLQNLGTNNEGGDFVVSFDARVLKNTTINVNFCDIGAEENHGDIALTTTFQHYVLHFKNIQSDYLNKALYNGFIDFEPKTLDETNQLYVANFMLERGTIPSEKFSISEADRNNYGKESFTDWEKDPRVQIVNDTINGNSVQAYKIEGVPSGETYVNMLQARNLQKTMKIQPQKVYTLSFWAKASESGHGIYCYLWPDISDIGLDVVYYKGINGAGTQEQKTSSVDGATLCEIDSTWRKFYIHWHPHKVGDTINCNVGRLFYNMVVWLSDVKLEEGYICEENISNQETYSSIKQTAESIMMNVNNTYVKIGDGNITLNGETKVNGSLTLNDEDQGFLLLGDGGTTELSPKSIGTYNEFKSKTTNTIKTHFNSTIFGSPTVDGALYGFSWNVSQKLGTFKKGSYIKLLDYTNVAFANVGPLQTGIGTPSATFYIHEGGTTTKTITVGDKTSVDIGNYTVVGDNVEVMVTGRFTKNVSASIWGTSQDILSPRDTNITIKPIRPMPSISVTVDWKNEVPKTSAFMLLGYDGFAASFGTNTTVYCGKDGFIANYGDSIFKITTDGIVERRNGASIATVEGSTSSSNPYIYEVPDTVDTILCKTGNTIIKLPSKPYQGQRIKIHDKSPNGETWINFQGYMVRANNHYNTRTYQSKFQCDGQYVRIYTFIDNTWYEEFTG